MLRSNDNSNLGNMRPNHKSDRTIGDSKETEELEAKLNKMGERINCHDGTFTAEDMLENAEEIAAILKRYLEIRNK